jgi:hypothetical protein
MQEVNSLPGSALPKFRPPVTHSLNHVLLQLLQFCDVFFKRADLAFEDPKHSPARNSTLVSRAQNLGEFGKRKSELQGTPDHVDPFRAVCRI